MNAILRILLFISVAFFTIQGPLSAEEFQLTRVDGSILEYHLTNVHEGQKQDLVLMLQGSDCNSAYTNETLQQLSKVKKNAAILFIEKYGLTSALPRGSAVRDDCPTAYLKNDVPSKRVLDALQVISELRVNSDWWSKNLTVIGASSGAIVAQQVALLVPETKKLVILGFGSQWFKDDLLFSIKQSLSSAGAADDERLKILEQIQNELEIAAETHSTGDYMSGHSYAYWAELMSIDQLELLKQIRVPILAIQGGRDDAVSPNGAHQMISEAKNLGADITFIMFEKLDHQFRLENGESKLEEVSGEMKLWVQE